MLAARRLIPRGARSAAAPRRLLRAPTGHGESPAAPGPRPPPPSPEAAPGLRPAPLLLLVPGPGVSPRMSAPAGVRGRWRGPGRGCRCPQSCGLRRVAAIAAAIAAVCFHPLRAGGEGRKEEGREGRREVPECPQRHFPHAAVAPPPRPRRAEPAVRRGRRSPRPSKAGQCPAPLPPVPLPVANLSRRMWGRAGGDRLGAAAGSVRGGTTPARVGRPVGCGAPGKSSAHRGCETARRAARGSPLPRPGAVTGDHSSSLSARGGKCLSAPGRVVGSAVSPPGCPCI